jgi:hypothetical protein
MDLECYWIRKRLMTDYIDWIAVAHIDEIIIKTEARINNLENRKAEIQTNDDIDSKLPGIGRDIQHEKRRLADLKRERRDLLGYLC